MKANTRTRTRTAAPAKPASRYSGSSKTAPTMDANYVRPGTILLRINQVEEGENRKREEMNFVNCTTLACLAESDAINPATKKPFAPMRPGEDFSVVFVVKTDYFLANWKQFVLCATDGSDEAIFEKAETDHPDLSTDDGYDEVYGALCAGIAGEDQLLAGTVMELEVTYRLKKESREKDEDKLTADDFSKRTTWKRRVPFAEVAEILDEAAIDRFFPGDALEKLIAEEASD